MNIKNLILKNEWYEQGFLACPYILAYGSSGLSMKSYFPFAYTSFVYFFKNDYVEMSYGVEDMKRIWGALKHKPHDYFIALRKEYEERMKDFEAEMESMSHLDWKSLSEEELFSTYRKIFAMADELCARTHFLEAFDMTEEIDWKKIVGAYVQNPEERDHIVQVLTFPTEQSWATQQEDNLRRIAHITDKKAQREALEEHAKKYFWVRNNYVNVKALTADDFEEELESFHASPSQKFSEEERKKYLKLLSPQEKELLWLTDFLTALHDVRKQYVLMSVYYLHLVTQEIGRRFGFSETEAKYLLPTEMNAPALQTVKKEDLQERRKGMLIVHSQEGFMIKTGNELRAIEAEVRKKVEHVDDFRGMTASVGTAEGRVVVCTSASSIEDVQKGDILVASMTRPEFVPAMKKSAAVITDEGGVTCHAAIISRELGIPCIIGTRIATKVLHTGDIVEVRAQHGVVRIVRRAKA